MNELASGRCQVWWAGPADARADHLGLLDDAEAARHARLRRAPDRDRFVVAAALLRTVVSGHLGCRPAEVVVDRTCARCGQPHGKPAVPGSGLEVSLSHSGDRVVLAVTRSGPVGVDVEQVTRDVDIDGMAGQVLAPAERAVLAGLPDEARRPAFFTSWTRKEAVVKATGDGLNTALASVEVSPPDRPAELFAYPEKRVTGARMADLAAGDGYAACLAVLGELRLPVDARDGRELLRRH
jgi:4'-phosphopantetheinyl transferase